MPEAPRLVENGTRRVLADAGAAWKGVGSPALAGTRRKRALLEAGLSQLGQGPWPCLCENYVVTRSGFTTLLCLRTQRAFEMQRFLRAGFNLEEATAEHYLRAGLCFFR